MARTRSPRIDKTPFEADILDLSHDGRGVARRAGKSPEESGKAVFITGALPGERVMAEQTAKNRHFDEARTIEVLQASPHRVAPRCIHFGTCGGCVLQHMDESQQIIAKHPNDPTWLTSIGFLTLQSPMMTTPSLPDVGTKSATFARLLHARLTPLK